MSIEARLKKIRVSEKWDRHPYKYVRTYLNPSNLPRFVPRAPELRAIEGRYLLQGTDRTLVISCKWNDILRCADSKHYAGSCFSPERAHAKQPVKRLFHADWAVMFIPDRAGTPQWRSWIRFVGIDDSSRVKLQFSRPQGTLELIGKYWRDDVSNLLVSTLKDVAILEEIQDIYL